MYLYSNCLLNHFRICYPIIKSILFRCYNHISLSNERDIDLTSHILIAGDCLVEMGKLECESIDLVITDPPFNIGKKYGGVYNDNMEFDDYLDWCKTWLKKN